MSQLIFSILFIGLEILIIHNEILTEQKRKPIYFFLFFAQFFVFAGFRGLTIHNDTISYVTHFVQDVSPFGHFWEYDHDERFEIGYLFVEKFIHNNITSTPSGFILVTSLIVCLCSLFFFYKKSEHMGISLFLFYVSGSFFTQFGVLRESFAVFVGYLALHYLERDKIVKSFVFASLAFFFHKSAIILLFIILLNRLELKRRTKILIFCGVVVILYSFAAFINQVAPLLGMEESIYFVHDNAFTSINGLFNGSVSILSTLLIYKMVKNANRSGVPVFINNILFLCLLVSVLTLRLPILNRYLMFFQPYLYVLVSNYTFYSKENKRLAVLATLVIASDLIIKQWLRPDWVSIFPYSFY